MIGGVLLVTDLGIPNNVLGGTLTFTPAADTYVDAASPTANYGTRTTLRTDASPVVISYLRFSLANLSGPIASVLLRVYANSSSATGYTVNPVNNDTWGETSLTWNNAPVYGASIGASGAFSAGAWTQVDVTSLVTGNGDIDIALVSSSTTAVSYASRESGTNAPELIVSLSPGGASPTATAALNPTPTGSGANPTPTPVTYPSPTSTPVPTPTLANLTVTLLAAGDIANCKTTGDQATAAILAKYPSDPVITLGDNAYADGSLANYQQCYDPTWGQFKARTYPSLGNHEYLTSGASGYFTYFSGFGGPSGNGYYSYNLGDWHVVVLNSNCSDIGGCQAGSPEETWLKADLAAHPSLCTLAYWHHPLFTSGQEGDTTAVRPLWQDLYNAGAELVLNGHDHDYERFKPQTPTGSYDPAKGIVEIVSGTGGSNHTKTGKKQANSVVFNNQTFGVLKLTLNPSSYAWQFLPVSGATFTDSGSANCH